MSALSDRVRVVVREVRAGKLGRDRLAIADYVGKVFTLSTVEQNRIVYAVIEETADDPPSERDTTPRPPPSDVLIGDDLVDAAAALFKKHPKATSRVIYQMLVEDGRAKVGVSPSSFMNGGYASRARVKAGVRVPSGLGGRPKAVKGRKSEPPAKKKKSAGAPKRPASESPPPAREPAAVPAPAAATAVEVTAPATITDKSVDVEQQPEPRPTDGDDVVFLRSGGATIEAHRRGDGWEVALSCTVPDDQLDGLVGLVWNRQEGS